MVEFVVTPNLPQQLLRHSFGHHDDEANQKLSSPHQWRDGLHVSVTD